MNAFPRPVLTMKAFHTSGLIKVETEQSDGPNHLKSIDDYAKDIGIKSGLNVMYSNFYRDTLQGLSHNNR